MVQGYKQKWYLVFCDEILFIQSIKTSEVGAKLLDNFLVLKNGTSAPYCITVSTISLTEYSFDVSSNAFLGAYPTYGSFININPIYKLSFK